VISSGGARYLKRKGGKEIEKRREEKEGNSCEFL
jgi:hypothetical protein